MKGLLGTTPGCPSFTDLGGAVRPIQTPGRFFNMSINQHPEQGFAATARSANYVIDPNTGIYEVDRRQSTVINKTHFSRLDSDLNPLGWSDVTYVGGPKLVRGPEDPRLLVRDGDWYLLVVLLEKAIPKARMALYRLDPETSIASFVEIFAKVENEEKPEKNWVFKSRSVEPDFTYNRNLSTNLRGGTPAVEYKSKFLSVAHTTYYSKEKWYNPNTFGIMQVLKRSYTHRFVLHDTDLSVLATSAEFTFGSAPIEFAAGLASADNKLHISLGQNDSSSLLASIDLDTIDKLLTGEK